VTNPEAHYQWEWMCWTKERGNVELGQQQYETELKIEQYKAIGTQHTGESHVDSAASQAVT